MLVEHHGPWGASAPRDTRLPAAVKEHLSGHPNVKVLMVRRHDRARRGSSYAVMVGFPGRGELFTTTVTDPAELTAVDLDPIARGEAPPWTLMPGPLYGVCTHGRHDTCCAERGRPVAAALTAVRPEATWEISHMGGDRFAANLLVLPEGLYYGGLDPASAAAVAERHEQGRLDLAHLRGRSSYPMLVQYAETALRLRLDEDRASALRLVRRRGGEVTFRHEETDWTVVVRRDEGAAVRLTCGTDRLSPLPVHEVVSIEGRPALSGPPGPAA